MDIKKLNEQLEKFLEMTHGKSLTNVPKEEWIGKIMTVPFDGDYEIVELDDEDGMAIMKNVETDETCRMSYKFLINPNGYMAYIKGTEIEE